SAMPCDGGFKWQGSLLYYDAGHTALQLFATDASEICRWNESWTSFTPELPFQLMGATYDPLLRTFVLFHHAHLYETGASDVASEIWAVTDGDYHRVELPHAPQKLEQALAVYTPGRSATVLCGGTDPMVTEAWTFDGSNGASIVPPAWTGSP